MRIIGQNIPISVRMQTSKPFSNRQSSTISRSHCADVVVNPALINDFINELNYVSRGPFVAALDKTWCPDHFTCSNPQCQCALIGVGFVEEEGQLFCERDFEQYLAPRCGKCGRAIMRVTYFKSLKLKKKMAVMLIA